MASKLVEVTLTTADEDRATDYAKTTMAALKEQRSFASHRSAQLTSHGIDERRQALCQDGRDCRAEPAENGA